ncbi:hypothetical protein Hs30E_14270 [Lactococcus hodotermopsidis]|uniref:Aspartate racemase n=1 Tax=Pseudolactococcus hodotermopsidis TaxID=2709157 RepID=A0A6A0BDJ1_9LACT|nr:hypothetical protein Hs30E_14270 [Lactococcus hodotermopsidis]
MLGGMSWESSVDYYKIINQVVKSQLGGLHSAKIVLYSVDFAEIEARSVEILSKAAQSLERADADFIGICTNTMHKVATEIQSCVTIPIVHIADTTADNLLAQGMTGVGLTGTRYILI